MKLNRTITVLALATGALVGGMTPALAAGATGAAAPQGVSVLEDGPSVISGPSGGYSVYYRLNGQTTDCPKERLCLSVWDTTKSPDQWKVFAFRTCGVYNIKNWLGNGYWENNQTGKARGTFYSGPNGTGNSNTTDKPYSYGAYGWTPINSIRPC
ncbi:hypothetical protein ACFRCG_44575 [Embleya sp. NPDC056575]|uniref:hypothetical protein n=1 Tax=unclassified Embleya TaxID=2699296 RepID=UPI0036C71DCA